MSGKKVEIQTYKNKQSPVDKEICDLIASIIETELTEAENKMYSHVWDDDTVRIDACRAMSIFSL